MIQAIGVLLTRKWWSRVWIVQEVQLARDVLMVCGDFGIPLDYMRMAIKAISRFGHRTRLGEKHSDTAKAIRRHITYNPPKMLNATSPQVLHLVPKSKGLEDVLIESNGLNATNPRDHIFALLSMVEDSDIEELGIQVDYNKTMDEIFREAAGALIEKRRALYIISWCQKTPAKIVFNNKQKNEKEEAILPSWVPNWSSSFPAPIWISLKTYESFFSASGRPTTENTATPRIDKNVLLIPGHDFDVVKTVSKQSWIQGTESDPRFFAPMCIWEAKKLLADNWKGWTTEMGHEIVLRTIVADTDLTHPDFAPIPASVTGHLGRAFNAVIKQINKEDPGVRDKEFVAQRDHLFKLVARVFQGRTLFVTSRGHLGLGDEKIKEGDRVCIFLGAPVPFVLRVNETKTSDGMPLHQLVGECYVHGIMYGEALKGDLPTVTFAIH
jgi:hypothetical protein